MQSTTTPLALPPIIKEKGQISVATAKKALAEGARLLSHLLAPNWCSNSNETRSLSQSIQRSLDSESQEKYFEEAVRAAEQ